MMKRVVMISFVFVAAHFTALAQQMQTTEDAFGTRSMLQFADGYDAKELPASGLVKYSRRDVQGNVLKAYQVNGQTSEHLPTGKWTLREASWQYEIGLTGKAVPAFSAAGKRMTWEGNFKQGVPEGKWTYVVDSITHNEKLIRTLMKVELSYRNGIPVGAFFVENNSTGNALKVKGQTDAQGFATGTWKAQYLTADKVTEQVERVYKDGLLVAVNTINSGKRVERPVAHNIAFLDKPNDAPARKIGTHRFAQDEAIGLSAALTQKSLQDYFGKAWSLKDFPLELNLATPAFRRLQYPLTDEELKDIAAAQSLIQSQLGDIESILQGNVNILRSASVEMDTSIAYLQLRAQRLYFTDSLLGRVDAPLFTYKNRFQQGLDLWISGLNGMRRATGTVHDSVMIILPEIHTQAYTPSVFAALKNYMTQSAVDMNAYTERVRHAALILNRQGELKALEDDMAVRLDTLTTFYASQTGIGALLYNNWLKGELQSQLQKYSNTEAYETALEQAKNIAVSLDSLDAWKSKLGTFDSMPAALKTQYSYLAYNPYTGQQDIEVIIKRRFINKVLEELWPFMIQEMEQEKDWQAFSKQWEQQFAVYEYLMAFAGRDDQPARRLEDKVRKEKKAAKMLRSIVAQITQ